MDEGTYRLFVWFHGGSCVEWHTSEGCNRLTREQLDTALADVLGRSQFMMHQVMSWSWLDAVKGITGRYVKAPEPGQA